MEPNLSLYLLYYYPEVCNELVAQVTIITIFIHFLLLLVFSSGFLQFQPLHTVLLIFFQFDVNWWQYHRHISVL